MNHRVSAPALSRRTFLRHAVALGAATTLSACAGAPSTVKRVPRVGILSLQPAPASSSGLAEALVADMRDLGYENGKNIQVSFHWNNEVDTDVRGAKAAAEVVALQVDVIVAYGNVAQRGAKATTSTIPIVIFAGPDPVEAGLVESLARPGGNVTGVAGNTALMSAKGIELLKESFPSVSRVAIISDFDPDRKRKRRAAEDAAHALGLDFVTVEVRSAADVPAALEAADPGVDALLVFSLWVSPHERAFAATRRIPALYATEVSVDNGGLMTYVEDHFEMARRVASYVVRILNGEQPATMPIEQATKYRLVINLKTAREQGLTIPQSVLSRATRVIEQ